MGNLKSVEQFRFWAHKIIPLVYDESLSYYEFLCKVVAKLNEVIEAVDGQNEHIQEFEQAITVLVEQYRNDLEGELKDLKDGITHEWAKNTAYAVNDYVWYESKIKQCTESHTSGDEFDGTKWRDYPVVDWVKDEVARLEDLIANGAGNAVDRFESPVISHYKGSVTRTAVQEGSLAVFNVLDGLSVDNNRRYFIMFKAPFYPQHITLVSATEHSTVQADGVIERLNAPAPYNTDGVFFATVVFNIPDSFAGYPIISSELKLYDAPDTTTPYTVEYEMFGVARVGSGSVTNPNNKIFGSSDFGYMLGAIWATMNKNADDITQNTEEIQYNWTQTNINERNIEKLTKSKTGLFTPNTDEDKCRYDHNVDGTTFNAGTASYNYYGVFEDPSVTMGGTTYLVLIASPVNVMSLASGDAQYNETDVDNFVFNGGKYGVAFVTTSANGEQIYLRGTAGSNSSFAGATVYKVVGGLDETDESRFGVLPMASAIKWLETEIQGATQYAVYSADIRNIVKCTQTVYDNMSSHDANTLYLIVG